MATIEPRLIHLLNESTTPQFQHADLPPLYPLPQPPAAAVSSERLLAPLEPDAGLRGDWLPLEGTPFSAAANNASASTSAVANSGSSSLAPSSCSSSSCTSTCSSNSSCSSCSSSCSASSSSTSSSVTITTTPLSSSSSSASASASYPLRRLLAASEGPGPDSSQTLNCNLIDPIDSTTNQANAKKRARKLNLKDDFVQLPQPVKKQKASQQAPAMPPIINGLHEPPPHAALFPPIASNSLTESDASQMKLLHDFTRGLTEEKPATASSPPEFDRASGRGRKRAAKPRRKWSEEETKHLLLGVNRHGVGKWTSILEDLDFKFNGRTAGDLKDRFRTCCPVELCSSSKKLQPQSPPYRQSSVEEVRSTLKHGSLLENFLIKEDDPLPATDMPTIPSPNVELAPKQRKSRAHRKKLEDLAQMGIHGPFKRSLRRERRPFTDQDDRGILEGLDIYGPAWTKIQRDPRFHLSSRQPTDLRDRVRNKYPAVYQRIEKGLFQARDEGRGNDVLEPSIDMSIDDSLKRSRAAAAAAITTTTGPSSQAGGGLGCSREEFPAWPSALADPLSSHLQSVHGFDFGEGTAPPFIGGGGEMDISRLLLDDARFGPMPARVGIDGLAGSSPSTVVPPERGREQGAGHTVKC